MANHPAVDVIIVHVGINDIHYHQSELLIQDCIHLLDILMEVQIPGLHLGSNPYTQLR